MLISWKLFVDACRLTSLCAFVLCSLTFNWYSFASLIMLLASLYLLDREQYSKPPSTKALSQVKNPYKGKRRVKDEDQMSDDLRNKYTEDILDFVLYDVEDNQAIQNFEPVKSNTHCIFSQQATVWGCRDYDRALSLEENVLRSIPALIKFLHIGDVLHLDGFVFELPGDEFGCDVHAFGQGVRRVLECISDHDPSGFHCMNKSYVAHVGWSFEFNRTPIFVTTFAPCYPENHSRFAFGAKSGFILLQPMYSFAIHDIGNETPHTNWENPKTIRDKIRVAYKENGRPYQIRDTVYYPAAHDLVKPLVEGPGRLLEWWKADEKDEEEDEEEDEKEDEKEDEGEDEEEDEEEDERKGD